jgi:hypothetical protein
MLITTFSLWFSLAGRNGFYLFEEPQAKNGFVARVATRRGLSKDRPEVTSLDGTKPGFDVSGETANRNPIDLIDSNVFLFVVGEKSGLSVLTATNDQRREVRTIAY